MAVEEVLRAQAPAVLSALARRYGDFAACEDAVQEALLAASMQWPSDGVPENPRSWLITVASRRRIEVLRSEAARVRRESAAEPSEPASVSSVDDSLTLLMLCCHPELTPPSQVALTLRAVGGLTTGEIARAFLVPEATIGQRISRAKAKLQGARFALPPEDELAARLTAVLHVLYLIFNEGYTASSGESLHRVELSAEAIRLTRQLRAQLPDEGEVAGLLALMLLTDARRPARTTPEGHLVRLPEQDRSRWDPLAIAEGIELITTTLATAPVGPYQLQAAIAAVHDQAADADATDWRQILMLYELLEATAPGPMVTLNRTVAVAMVHGPTPALALLDTVDPALTDHHRLAAVRAHLHELAGNTAAARESYLEAARLTQSTPEHHYLQSRADALLDD
ncbi:sigma-70 family RNA polymerase sigma factor [Kribbella sp. NBC_01505]|uniref:RNA polymerase sigma factor n=1 Tax=Kribbella sp. NBC_01505 TaxID=2903580 RepID=UPI0038702B82